MYKAFGIVNSSSRNIRVEGLEDYRPIGALYILFGPLYSFRDQLDVLTVSTSYKSTLADVYAIGNKCTYYDSTIFHNSTWHKYAVNYICTWSYLSAGKDYRIGDLAFNYTALGYVSILDSGLCANIYI